MKMPTSRLALFSVILIMVIMIAAIDAFTGRETRMYPLYFIPITLASRGLPRQDGLAIAGICTLFWVISKYLEGTEFSSPGIWFWNTAANGIAFFYVAILVSRLHEQHAYESASARQDRLTELLNSRGFQEQAKKMIALCQRHGHPLVMAYIDLDNFKKVNDTLGHQRGDEVLCLAANIMKTTFRATDVIGRLGGDEFAVLMENSSPEQAQSALERLRVEIMEAMLAQGCDVTASVGAVACRSAPRSLDALTKEADEVMYAVKQSGKNQVRLIESQ